MAEGAQRRPAGLINDLIVDLLRRRRRPLKGHEIVEQLKAAGASVYASQAFRALAQLRASGVIHRVELSNSYALGAEGTAISLICDRCGRVEEVPARDVANALSEMAALHFFVPSRLVMEVIGDCARCIQRRAS